MSISVPASFRNVVGVIEFKKGRSLKARPIESIRLDVRKIIHVGIVEAIDNDVASAAGAEILERSSNQIPDIQAAADVPSIRDAELR
jgi:hypothetical protein